jgi:AbrB family looped-hinge helix DNA binding protein
MPTATIGPDFSITIPPTVRQSLGLLPGQRLVVLTYGDRIELIPQRPARELRGSLRGMRTDLARDADRG